MQISKELSHSAHMQISVLDVLYHIALTFLFIVTEFGKMSTLCNEYSARLPPMDTTHNNLYLGSLYTCLLTLSYLIPLLYVEEG